MSQDRNQEASAKSNSTGKLWGGISIKAHYFDSGVSCVSECFDGQVYRYLDTNGKAMPVEVPADKYDAAILSMEKRIRAGLIPGVTNEDDAERVVLKGSYTYEQVRNIAKFGSVEGLLYSSESGVNLTGTSMGVSSVIAYALSIWAGSGEERALEDACRVGLGVGGADWIGGIITDQLGKKEDGLNLEQASDWVMDKVGSKVSSWIAGGVCSSSRFLRGNVMTGIVSAVVVSSADLIRVFQGQVSVGQLVKNVTSTATSIIGGSIGAFIGAGVGATVGSVIPIVGTFIVGLAGAFAGAWYGGNLAGKATKNVLDQFIEDDAREMLSITGKVFGNLAFEYLLNEKEAKVVVEEFNKNDIPRLLRTMFASDDRELVAKKELEPIIINVAAHRPVVILPTDDQVIEKTCQLINEVILESPDLSNLP